MKKHKIKWQRRPSAKVVVKTEKERMLVNISLQFYPEGASGDEFELEDAEQLIEIANKDFSEGTHWIEIDK